MLQNLMLVAQWIADSFPIIRAGLIILVAISCIVLIIAVLASPPQTGVGRNAITGASESYYTKNKGSNNQGRIRNLVIICAIVIAVCSILFGISYTIYQAPIGS